MSFPCSLFVSSSFEWKGALLKEAAKGEAAAQYRLGELYWLGKGVESDKRQAAAWYRKAAEQGWSEAQSMLAHMCSRGYGVPKDPVEAYKWYSLCTEETGEDLRKRVIGDMTSKDVAEAERRVVEFLRRAKAER